MVLHNKSAWLLCPLLLAGCTNAPPTPPVTAASPATPQIAQPAPPNCSTQPDSQLAYQIRDDNRCEGTYSTPVSGGTGVQLRSFSVGDLPETWPDRAISLHVPTATASDTIELEFLQPLYLIDRFSRGFDPNGFQFEQPTQWLERANVNPRQFRALAERIDSGHPLYLPVILGQPAEPTHRFRARLIGRLKVRHTEIRRNDQTLDRQPGNPDLLSGESIEHRWTPPPDAPADTYTFSVAIVDGSPYDFEFRYDPAWYDD